MLPPFCRHDATTATTLRYQLITPLIDDEFFRFADGAVCRASRFRHCRCRHTASALLARYAMMLLICYYYARFHG